MRTRNHVASVALGVAAASLFAVAAAMLTGVTCFPEATEKVVGQIKVTIQQAVAPDIAEITLRGSGGARELDNAGFGDWVFMEGYVMDGVPPVYSAHNNRGGDVVLGWEIGQHVLVTDSATGASDRYVFVEEVTTPKRGTAVALVGMRGALALQTCFYGEQRMRFVNLIPLDQWELETSQAGPSAS